MTHYDKLRSILGVALVLSLAPSWAQDGMRDASFNGTGWNYHDFNGFNFGAADEATDLVVQSTGKIVLVGTWKNGPGGDGWDWGFVRYLASGTLDTSFANNGVGATAVTFSERDDAYSVLADPTDRLYIGGVSFTRAAICRYTVDGVLDTTFGVSGMAIDTNAVASTTKQLFWDGDDRLVGAGSYNGYAALSRYTMDGVLDASFGNAGWAMLQQIPPDAQFEAGAFDPSTSTYVAAGSFSTGGSDDIVLARFKITGELDTTLAGTGWLTISPSAFSDVAHAVAIDSEHRIVVGGSTSSGSYMSVLRYLWDGGPDTTWNGTGATALEVSPEDDRCHDLVIQPDCRIILAGASGDAADRATLVRYMPDGTLDSSFALAGIQRDTITASYDTLTTFNALRSDGAGNIVAAGRAYVADAFYPDFFVARYFSSNDLSIDCTPGLNVAVNDEAAGMRSSVLAPNPCNGTFRILEEEGEGTLLHEVRVVDSTGRCRASFFNVLRGDVLTLPAIADGLYLVQIRINDVVTTQPLLVGR